MIPAARLTELFAPVAVSEFFADYYEQKPAVMLGSPDRGRGLLDLDRFLAAIAKPGERRGKVQVDTAHLRPDPPISLEALRGYVAGGHPILWNGARGVTPAIDDLSNDLARALDATVWPNIYSTGSAGSPFGMHFDAHEVLALQIEGRKEWTISSVRVDRPLDALPYRADLQAALNARRDEATREVLMTPVLGPGDLLYIPRGLFHSARACEGRSLHITFGIQPLTGYDVLETLVQAALKDRDFRTFFPPAALDPDGGQHRDLLAGLASRLVHLIEDGTLEAGVRALQERRRKLEDAVSSR